MRPARHDSSAAQALDRRCQGAWQVLGGLQALILEHLPLKVMDHVVNPAAAGHYAQ